MTREPMAEPKSTMAQPVAQEVSDSHQQRTGRVPKAVTVVLSEDQLVVTLHEALSPAENALGQSPETSAGYGRAEQRGFAGGDLTLIAKAQPRSRRGWDQRFANLARAAGNRNSGSRILEKAWHGGYVAMAALIPRTVDLVKAHPRNDS